jgi:lysophospholipase L1-like esterase
MGGAGDKQWTKLIQAKLLAGNKRTDWDVTTLGGSGYINTGSANKNFTTGIEEPLMGNADIAILFGSRNDASSPLANVLAIAPKTINRYKERNPSAKLIVIGPTWVTGNPPANLLAIRDAIKDATTVAGGTFVDPLTDGWFFGPDARLIGADGVHPSDEGNQYIADKILPVVSAALTK